MVQPGIDVVDYHAGDETDLQDPTATHEEVARDFMDKLAKTITRFEEVLNAGQADVSLRDLSNFINARGDALDMLDDPQLAEWLNAMRLASRCPYRKFSVRG